MIRRFEIFPRSAQLLHAFLGVLLLWPLGAAETLPDGWVDVSSGLGAPLGGLGTGYMAFGAYGIVRENLDGRPKDGMKPGEWEYTAGDLARSAGTYEQAKAEYERVKAAGGLDAQRRLPSLERRMNEIQQLAERVKSPNGFVASNMGFSISEGDTSHVLQTAAATWKPGALPFTGATVTVCPPRLRADFTSEEAGLLVKVDAFTPLLPYDLAASTVPVQVYDLTVVNTGTQPRQLTLALENGAEGTAQGDRVRFAGKTGELLFAAPGGRAFPKGTGVEISLAPGAEARQRFVIAWHYPSVNGTRRYYMKAFANAGQVADLAIKEADGWKQRIEKWHASVDVPAFLKRLWFSSLASIMTSTFMTEDGGFYEVETPHPCLNTMDVSVYSGWPFLIWWPEIERRDMDQYLALTPTSGPKAGRILHSLPKDEARYVEEPTFLCRLRRDALWFNDPAWARAALPIAALAAQRVFNEGQFEGLIDSKQGTQSYDIWPMPGTSSYVNSAWIYGLDGLRSLARSAGAPEPEVGGRPAGEVLAQAKASYQKYLWNPQTKAWNLFYRTEGASRNSTPDTVFTDQLFGRWVAAIDPDAGDVLLKEQVRSTLQTLYTNNLVEDSAQGFRGWVNGMKPGRLPDSTTGFHARTFWLGPQINLASLLGLAGDEKASLDVMRSIESSLHNNHMAVGEWNRSINAKGEVQVLPEEPSKDTPRFAPYPRYKSSWEYLIRLIGLTMNDKSFQLAPFRTVPLRLEGITLAGTSWNIRVEPGWTRATVDGKPASLPLTIPRDRKKVAVEFLR